MLKLLQEAPAPSQQSIKRRNLSTRRTLPTNVRRGEEVLSRHTVVLFQWRNVMTGEICRAEPEFEGLFFNEWKMKPGSWICMTGLETNHEAQWALEQTDTLCCSQEAEAQIPKICTCMKKKQKLATWLHFGGVDSSLSFCLFKKKIFYRHQHLPFKFGSPCVNQVWGHSLGRRIKSQVKIVNGGDCWVEMMSWLHIPATFLQEERRWPAANLIITWGSFGYIWR